MSKAKFQRDFFKEIYFWSKKSIFHYKQETQHLLPKNRSKLINWSGQRKTVRHLDLLYTSAHDTVMWYRQADTLFDSSQLIITWMSNIDKQKLSALDSTLFNVTVHVD